MTIRHSMTIRHGLKQAAFGLPVAALLALPHPGLAQAAEADDLDPTLRTMSVHSMLELDVVTADGENLGEVYDLIGDPTDGVFKFLVVDLGGNLLGFNETRAAIPWHRVDISGGERQFVLDMTAEEVSLLPNWEGERTTGAAVSAAPMSERPDVPEPASGN